MEGEESRLPAAEEEEIGVPAVEPPFQSDIAREVSENLGSRETGVDEDEDDDEEELMEENRSVGEHSRSNKLIFSPLLSVESTVLPTLLTSAECLFK